MHISYLTRAKQAWLIGVAMFALVTIGSMGRAMADNGTADNEQHMVTIYDRGVEQTIITRAGTVREALAQARISVDAVDIVEPSLDWLPRTTTSTSIGRDPSWLRMARLASVRSLLHKARQRSPAPQTSRFILKTTPRSNALMTSFSMGERDSN